MLRKNFAATGSFIAEDRPGPSTCSAWPASWCSTPSTTAACTTGSTGRPRPRLRRARAHNRGMVEFCSVDDRLLPTCYVPLADFDRAPRRWPTRRSPWAPPRCSSPRAARRATPPATSGSTRCGPGPGGRHPRRLPRRRHRRPHRPDYFHNGCPIPPDFHGGDENFRSVDYMGIPGPPMQTLATMIFDGVLERFPELRIGVIEQGAIWVPSWMRQMESAFDAFARHEERLQSCRCARPSTCAARSGHALPHRGRRLDHRAGRPRGVLFSSDFPHVEGGRRPVERFEPASATPS
jgi:uncharacterized protein